MGIIASPSVQVSCGPGVPAPLTEGVSARLRPLIVVGVTHSQSCLALTGRLRALRTAGFRVTLISSPGRILDRTAASQGVEAFTLPIARKIAPFADLISLARLCRLLYRIKPDMVEFSTPKAGLLGSLAAAVCRIPCRVYVLRGLKLETAKGLKRRILLAAERLAAACAHRVLCNSESLRSEAAALGVAPAGKLHLLGEGSSNGVDMARFSPGPSTVRRKCGFSARDLVIGFVGRLTRDKGLPELVQAFEVIRCVEPMAKLMLVGWFDAAEDHVDRHLRTAIEHHPQIRVTGFVPDPADYYRAMDLMVLPTWREGFPNSVLEAAASGVPVITTHSTGSRDSVVPEVTGLLIPPGYPEAIIEAVLTLLRDPERRKRMGGAARAWVMRHYADERVLELTVEFYRSLLAPERTARMVPSI